MVTTKTTLLTNVFNEEYLLPFFLEHHKNMFDEIIVIDYSSTDKSMEICKSICPEYKIIKTRNENFCAIEIDKEFMDIENKIEGIKIVLNTTEFLFCEKSIKEMFSNTTEQVSFAVNTVSPFSMNEYNVTNTYELFSNLLNKDVVYHHDRGVRQLHNFPNGRYDVGRHITYNVSTPTSDAHIVWFGYYPMNEKLMKRKLQIQQNIPQCDVDRGHGFHHFVSRDKILSINDEKVRTGIPLESINLQLYNLLAKKYKNTL